MFQHRDGFVVNEKVKAALQFARNASQTGSRNLLARDESYAAFLQQTVFPAREMLHEHEAEWSS